MTAVFALVVPGCGEPSVQDLCQRICDCQADGCQADYLTNCTDSLGGVKQDAEALDCAAEFDALLACMDDELTCEVADVVLLSCPDEVTALGACQDANRDPCQQWRDAILAEAEACGVEPIVDVSGECTEALGALFHCQDDCLAGATCESLSDPNDPDRAKLDACIADCN